MSSCRATNAKNCDREMFVSEEVEAKICAGEVNIPDCRGNPADVALIASAPKMLAALEAALPSLVDLVKIYGDAGDAEALEEVRAAIAAAKGGTDG